MRVQRRVWTTAAVTTAAVAGVLVFQGVTGASDADRDGRAADAKSAPAKSDVHRTALKTSADGDSASLARRDTEPFSLLGVTWTDPAAKVDGRVEARTRSAATGEWTGWLPLDTEIDGRTEATGPASAAPPNPAGSAPPTASRSVSPAPTGPGPGCPTGCASTPWTRAVPPARSPPNPSRSPPTGRPARTARPARTPRPRCPPRSRTRPPRTSLRPRRPPSPPRRRAPPPTPSASTASPTPSTSPTTPSASPTPTPGPPSTVPQPPIVSRAAWKADESLNSEAPDYLDQVKAVFVHHTAQTNAYSCADSAAIVRGLHTYHVKSNGWKDLGYNFIVDKCGTVFEGRKGGVDRPVMGAHTYGFNRDTAGIAVIGMYTDTKAATAATTAVARVAAWKLGQYKADPAGTVQLTAGANGNNMDHKKFVAGNQYAFQRISGHRDGFATECPGLSLYQQLPAIRTLAAGPVSGLTISSVTGANASGSTYYTQSKVTVGWKATTPAAFVKSYELLVGGKPVATVKGDASSASATLAVGKHTVQVRATHQSGKTSLSPAATVVADRTAPSPPSRPSPCAPAR